MKLFVPIVCDPLRIEDVRQDKEYNRYTNSFLLSQNKKQVKFFLDFSILSPYDNSGMEHPHDENVTAGALII